MREVTRTKEYTEHEAKIHFTNGETEEITFDGMKKTEEGVTLSDYMHTRDGNVKKRAVRFIPHNNLRDIETVERREASIDYTEKVSESKYSCSHCGERFTTRHERMRHEETCMYRPRRNTIGGRID